MLRELSELQESDEGVWGTTDLSFSIRTRIGDDEIVERTYVFNHAKEWDKWTLTEFEERRSPGGTEAWQTTQSASWHEPNEMPENIVIPPEVQEELAERLGVDKLVLQHP